jgi:hypothetical protein
MPEFQHLGGCSRRIERGQLELHTEFQSSLDYVGRTYLKKNFNDPKR